MRDLSQCCVLLVDDDEVNIDILAEALGNSYEVSVAVDGQSCLDQVLNSPPDLILLDILMPGMDGYEVCQRLKANPLHESIPVIFLTAKTELEDKTKGFQLGAVDYITKPFEVLEVQARVKTHLSLVLVSREIERQNEILEKKVFERTKELVLTQDVTIHCLTNLCEARDDETGGHILRTQHYVKALTRQLAASSPYSGQLDSHTIQLFFKSAPLHDIGKVGVPDAILFKPGPLTETEFAIMRGHCALGYHALQKSEKLFRVESIPSFLDHAKDIAFSHHENWNGEGYPRGLAGEEIPLSGRIMAVADVYDALVSKRVYKEAQQHQMAVDTINQKSGIQFDPYVIDAFNTCESEFKRIAEEFDDEHL